MYLDSEKLSLSSYENNFCSMFGKSQLHITTSVSVFFFFIIFLGSASTLFCLDAGRLARSQYPEGPETGHPDTGFSWFPCVLEQMLGWFPTLPSCHYMLHM